MRWIALALICTLIAGCSGDNTINPTNRGVELTLTVAPTMGDPQQSITIAATAVNAGMRSLNRWGGCAGWGGTFGLQVLDPRMNAVYLWDPTMLPLCPANAMRFGPGAKVQAAAQFDGTVYTSTGEKVQAEPGTYTVIVDFTTWRDGESRMPQMLERRATFEWNLR